MSHETACIVARTEVIKTRLRRHKLVFLQCGVRFEPIREQILSSLAATAVRAAEFASASDGLTIVGTLALTDVEVFALRGQTGDTTLGMLRKRVDDQLESSNVCLISRAPRIAYAPVPGSSLIEDAAPCFLELEQPPECQGYAGGKMCGVCLPSSGSLDAPALKRLFGVSLREMGVELLAALDHAIFEAGSAKEFLGFLGPREVEALRGAGHVRIVDGSASFVETRREGEFSEAVATALAEVVQPPTELAPVSDCLWSIERTIRLQLRQAAIQEFGPKWRRQVLHGDLSEKALERARYETNVTARSVADLRDPIEWLSLGELLEVVRSKTFDGLGVDRVTWDRFTQDVVPIRNRHSHMRLLRKGDRETVAMWVTRMSTIFPD